jgi:phenylpropionate dioxygenase-like ring-hydroxylating dioxygenase large terminal subunit
MSAAIGMPPVTHRWALQYPELGTGPVGLGPYLSKSYFESMRDKVFKKVWLSTGKRIEEIPSPGDYVTLELDFVPASLIIVRALDGTVRTYYNMCMHRANRLVHNDRGTCKGKITCAFHGWVYGLDGKLAVATEEDMFFNLERKSLSLVSVATDVWKGFIFINLDPKPTETLREHIGELWDMFSGYPFDELPLSMSYMAQLNSCWAIARDSQLEAYHVKYLHQRTAPGLMSYEEDPSRHALYFKLFNRHAVGSWYGARSEAALPPVAKLAAQYGQTIGSEATSLTDLNQWPKDLNPTRSKNWFFDEAYVFPNFHIVFLGLYAYIGHTFMPKTMNTCSWNARAYMPAPKTLVEQFSRESARCGIRDLWLEDGSTIEVSQRNIESGRFPAFQCQDQEIMIRHAGRVMDRMIGASQ